MPFWKRLMHHPSCNISAQIQFHSVVLIKRCIINRVQRNNTMWVEHQILLCVQKSVIASQSILYFSRRNHRKRTNELIGTMRPESIKISFTFLKKRKFWEKKGGGTLERAHYATSYMYLPTDDENNSKWFLKCRNTGTKELLGSVP